MQNQSSLSLQIYMVLRRCVKSYLRSIGGKPSVYSLEYMQTKEVPCTGLIYEHIIAYVKVVHYHILYHTTIMVSQYHHVRDRY